MTQLVCCFSLRIIIRQRLTVIVAVFHFFTDIGRKCRIRLSRTDKTMTFGAACNSHFARSVAIFIDITFKYRTSHKTARVASCRNIAQRKAVTNGSAIAQTQKSACIFAARGYIHGSPAPLNDSPLFISTNKAGMTGCRTSVGSQAATFHIRVSDNTIVSADHTAQHRTSIRSNITVDNTAGSDGTKVVQRHNCRIVREQHVGIFDG